MQIGPLDPGEVVTASFDTEVQQAPDGTLIDNVAVVDAVSLSTVIASNMVEVVLGQALPETGADMMMLWTSGSLLVVLGSVLVWAAYRRDEDDEGRPVAG